MLDLVVKVVESLLNMQPMEQIDNRVSQHVCDEELLLSHVICEDAELLYLDSFLQSVLRSEA